MGKTHLVIALGQRVVAAALFQAISRRYLKSSLVLTTNRGMAAWGQIFDDTVVAAALLDRLLHRSTVLIIEGESCRMRAHRARVEQLRMGLSVTAGRQSSVCGRWPRLHAWEEKVDGRT
ncbi:MAG: ATP-binding protein [Dehalococcoidia bacterium]